MIKIDREEVVSLLGKLISIESVNPEIAGGKGEVSVCNFIADYLESIGIEVHSQGVIDDRFNVIGILRGEDEGPKLMLTGHTDTVGVSGMIIDPFHPFLENGNIHGRGASDMKGSLAAMMAAAKALIESDVKLKGDLLIAAVVDEEYQSKGTERLIQEYQSDGVVVGEPTNFQIGIAHKGFVWLEITTKGKAAHGSVPEKGIDAIANMAKVIFRIEDLSKSYKERKHELVGSPSIHTSIIEGGSEWSIIPESCRLRLEQRTIPGEASSRVIDEISEILNDLSEGDPQFDAEVRKIFERKPMEVAPNTNIVESLRLAIQRTRRIPAALVGQPYWTDASLFVNEAHTPACLFGPGDISVAHSADEFVSINEVIESAMVYALTAQIFCGAQH